MRKCQQDQTRDYRRAFIALERRSDASVRATGRQRSLDRGGCRRIREVVHVPQRDNPAEGYAGFRGDGGRDVWGHWGAYYGPMVPTH
jgi:hypothetical protein